MNNKKLIAAIVFIVISVVIDIVVCAKVANHNRQQRSMYQTALKTTDKDRFNYIINSQQGNVITNARLTASEGVKFPEMTNKNKFMYVERTLEEYTMHTTVTTDSKGNIQTTTYWSWDDVRTDKRQTKKVSIYGKQYDASKFNVGRFLQDKSASKITNEKYSSYYYLDGDRRYRYEVVPIKIKGSFIAKAVNGTLRPIKGKTIKVSDESYRKYLKEKLDPKVGGVVIVATMLIMVEVIVLSYLMAYWGRL